MYFGKTAGVVGAIPGTRLAGRSPPARVPTIIIINRYDYSALFFLLFFVNTALARTELKATIAASLSSIFRRRMATMTIKTTTGGGRGAVEDEADVMLIINLASCGSITCTVPEAPRANMDRK